MHITCKRVNICLSRCAETALLHITGALTAGEVDFSVDESEDDVNVGVDVTLFFPPRVSSEDVRREAQSANENIRRQAAAPQRQAGSRLREAIQLTEDELANDTSDDAQQFRQASGQTRGEVQDTLVIETRDVQIVGKL